MAEVRDEGIKERDGCLRIIHCCKSNSCRPSLSQSPTSHTLPGNSASFSQRRKSKAASPFGNRMTVHCCFVLHSPHLHSQGSQRKEAKRKMTLLKPLVGNSNSFFVKYLQTQRHQIFCFGRKGKFVRRKGAHLQRFSSPTNHLNGNAFGLQHCAYAMKGFSLFPHQRKIFVSVGIEVSIKKDWFNNNRGW